MFLVCDMVLRMNRKCNCVLLCTLGGAISNMYAMLTARFKMFPEVKEKGMAAVPRLIAFTSEHVRVSVFSKVKGTFCKFQLEETMSRNALSLVVLFLEHILGEVNGQGRMGCPPCPLKFRKTQR